MSFGLGTAIGPLAAGYLVRFGFVVPFAFGAGLALIGVVLVYTQIEETVSPPPDGTGGPLQEPGVSSTPSD